MIFAAVDVETANRNQRSICQVAVVVFRDGKEVAADVVLVDPQEEFEDRHVTLHGISANLVRGAATYPSIHSRLGPILSGHHVLSHHTFDRIAFSQASAYHRLQDFGCTWVDSCVVARRVWPHLKDAGGFGLKRLAAHFGIPLRHHDALEDARAAGRIMLLALEESGQPIDHWARLSAPRARGAYRGSKSDVTREGDGDGPLLGETIVFTGEFSVDKFELADMAHIAGGAVRERVTRQTTMLVIGDLKVGVVGSDGRSSNLRYAEELAAKGNPILFIVESDFRELVRGPGGI